MSDITEQTQAEASGSQVNAPLSDNEDDGDNAPDSGGYFEFVNPQALQPVNETGESDAEEDATVAVSATAASSVVGRVVSGADYGTLLSDDGGANGADNATESEEGAGDSDADSFPAMSMAEVEAISQGSLRQLHREHAELSGPAAAAASDSLPLPAGLSPEKAAKLAQMRAAFAAARAAAAGGSVIHHPEMELAPGSTDFPDDYDSLQALDSAAAQVVSTAVARASTSFVPSASEPKLTVPASKVGSTSMSSTVLVKQHVGDEAFDPFGTGDAVRGLPLGPTRASATAPPASVASPKLPLAVRPVSPLEPAVKDEIRSIMARVKINPRGGAPAWTDRVVQAALRRTAEGQLPDSAGVIPAVAPRP